MMGNIQLARLIFHYSQEMKLFRKKSERSRKPVALFYLSLSSAQVNPQYVFSRCAFTESL